jgi:hypothetical protein
MAWDTGQQTLFDELRTKEMAGTLSPEEQSQLAQLIKALETDEARSLAPALAQMRAEQSALRERLLAAQKENEGLAQLLNQQEQLAADARRWLVQFEQRHRTIRQTYQRLTGESLTTSTGPWH